MGPVGPRRGNRTELRCSEEQYQAFWHRPHHLAVVFPQTRQGLLINVTTSIVCSKKRLEGRELVKGGEGLGIPTLRGVVYKPYVLRRGWEYMAGGGW